MLGDTALNFFIKIKIYFDRGNFLENKNVANVYFSRVHSFHFFVFKHVASIKSYLNFYKKKLCRKFVHRPIVIIYHYLFKMKLNYFFLISLVN
jgi:hypothetical protein